VDNLGRRIGRVLALGNYAYLADSRSGVQIVDISDPSSPTLAESFDTPGRAGGVAVLGNNIYVADNYSLMILSYTPTVIDEEISIPSSFSLFQNHPNPFNAKTTIKFVLPQASQVKIDAIDIAGRRVDTIADGQYQAGDNCVIWDAGDLSSGIYFAKMETHEESEIIKMVLLK